MFDCTRGLPDEDATAEDLLMAIAAYSMLIVVQKSQVAQTAGA
jgi:hypothetical protein